MATDLVSIAECRRHECAGGRVAPSSRTGVPQTFPESVARESDTHQIELSLRCRNGGQDQMRADGPSRTRGRANRRMSARAGSLNPGDASPEGARDPLLRHGSPRRSMGPPFGGAFNPHGEHRFSIRGRGAPSAHAKENDHVIEPVSSRRVPPAWRLWPASARRRADPQASRPVRTVRPNSV